MPDPLRIPAEALFARIDEYGGLWAMEPRAFAAHWSAIQHLDLAAHVRVAAHPGPKLRSSLEKQTAKNGKQIAIIKALGALMKQASSLDGGSTSTVQLRRDIRQAANDPEIAGILLAIDSPGGTVAGTDDLFKEVKAAAAKKPLWAQVEDLGASAAYWMAAGAEKIFANSPTALVGSIGTLMVVYDMAGLAEANGIKTFVFATGPLKGAGVEGSALSEEQAAYFQGLINDIQPEFDAAVKKGRRLSDKQLADVRTGAVFIASEALDRKLIDGIQPLEATLHELAQAATKSRNQPRSAAPLPEATMDEVITNPNAAVSQVSVTPQASTPASPPAVDVAAEISAMRRAQAEESRRIAAIRKLCADHGNPNQVGADGEPGAAIETAAIADGWDETKTELAILRAERLASLRNGRPGVPGIIVRGHDRDCTLQALQGAMILRFGGTLDHKAYQSQGAVALGLPGWLRAGINSEARQRAMEQAHRYSDWSAVDVCREAIRLDGRDAPLGRKDLIRASFSGSTLTNIFTTNVNAILLATYMETGDTTEGWTASRDVNDFRSNERPRLQKGPGLVKLPRGGEADHYSRTDQVESYKIARYARQFVVDEQDIIDDMLGAFAAMPIEMGQAARRLRPDLVYALILRNAALDADSVALFHATHSNLNTSASLTNANVTVCIAAMEKQQENSVNLGLRATHLIVPSDLKHSAAQIMNSASVDFGGDDETQRGTLNPINSEENLTLVSDSRLSNGVTDPVDGASQSGSTSTWYMASSMGHNVEVGYLVGTGRAPQVRNFQLSEGKWGLGWDINMDIGAKALDYRGMQKNTA